MAATSAKDLCHLHPHRPSHPETRSSGGMESVAPPPSTESACSVPPLWSKNYLSLFGTYPFRPGQGCSQALGPALLVLSFLLLCVNWLFLAYGRRSAQQAEKRSILLSLIVKVCRLRANIRPPTRKGESGGGGGGNRRQEGKPRYTLNPPKASGGGGQGRKGGREERRA